MGRSRRRCDHFSERFAEDASWLATLDELSGLSSKAFESDLRTTGEMLDLVIAYAPDNDIGRALTKAALANNGRLADLHADWIHIRFEPAAQAAFLDENWEDLRSLAREARELQGRLLADLHQRLSK